MNKIKYIISLLIMVISTMTFAQSNFINYQGLASDVNGNELQNQTITITVEIKFGSPTAIADYEETHSVTTNNFGVFSLQIGSGTVVSGDYSTLVWNDNTYVTTSIDGTEVGTTEMHAVPFALNSGDSVWQKNGNTISNTNSGNVGIGTTTPMSKLDIVENADGGEYKSAITFQDGGSDTDFWMARKDEGSAPGGDGLDNDKFVIGKGNIAGVNPYLTIASDGNIGIGTTTPLTKLHVNEGTIRVDRGSQIIGINPNFGLLNTHATIGTASNTPLRLQVNSDDKISILNNGNVGIGITNPTADLHVFSTSDTKIRSEGVNPRFDLFGANHWHMQSVDANGRYRIFDETNGAERFSILANGNIGIGTTTPISKLHIDNSDNATAWSTQITTGNNSGLLVDGLNILATNRVFQASNGAGTEMVVLGNGNVGIGTTNPSYNLEVSGNNNQFALIKNTATGDGLFIKAGSGTAELQTAGGSETLAIRTNGIERMRITNNGNIGIGTATPQATMHINGFMKLEPQNSAPTSPTKGMIYYDNNTDTIKVYTGLQWNTLGFL
jgi:hypothetical protein